jgi:hypothetical protein
LYPTPAHDDAVIDETLAAFDGALEVVASAWATGSTNGFLRGPAVKPVFRRYQECMKSRCGREYPDEVLEPCCHQVPGGRA